MAIIRERFAAFLARATDYVLAGRNRARIVIGTDRKDEISSGYGAGGENDPESASIDIVAGFNGESGNPSFESDKSRIYLSGKTKPDEYSGINKGSAVEGEAAIVSVSDNIYLKARNKVKIVGGDYSIVLEDGSITIEAQSKIELKVGTQKIVVNGSGIELDAGQAINGKIITDLDSCVGIDPVSGSPIVSNFKSLPLGAIVRNQKVVIK